MVNRIKTGMILSACGAFVLSFDTLMIQVIDAPPMTIAFWRGALMGIAGLGAWLLLRLTRANVHPLSMDRWGLLACVFYGLSSVCFVFGALLTSTANLLVIVATAPLWAAIGSLVVFHERTPAWTWVASTIALGGIVVVVSPSIENGFHFGDLIALFTAWSMAAAFVVSRASLSQLALAPAIGGLLSAVILMPFVDKSLPEHLYQVMFMLIEGGIIVPIALGLIGAAPAYLPAAQVGLFLLLETVLGPLWVWLVLGITPTTYALGGGAIVVGSLIANASAMLGDRQATQMG